MSNKTLILSVVIFVIISALAFWYFYPKQNPTIVPPNADVPLNTVQVQQNNIINQLNSLKPAVNNTQTPAQTTTKLNSLKPPQTTTTTTPADILNSLNSLKP